MSANALGVVVGIGGHNAELTARDAEGTKTLYCSTLKEETGGKRLATEGTGFANFRHLKNHILEARITRERANIIDLAELRAVRTGKLGDPNLQSFT